MARRVLFRHGPFKGQVQSLTDEVYAESLLASGYAVPAPPEKAVAEAVVDTPRAEDSLSETAAPVEEKVPAPRRRVR